MLMRRRPGNSKYLTQFDEIARGMALLGATDEEMAAAFDVTPVTINKWKTMYPTFGASLRAGKIMADAQVANSLHKRAMGYEHEAVKIFLREGDEEPVYAPYVKHIPPDVQAAKFWLMNRRGRGVALPWKERQEIERIDSIANMTPEQRMENVLSIMARARALLSDDSVPAAIDGEYTDAGYEDVAVVESEDEDAA